MGFGGGGSSGGGGGSSSGAVSHAAYLEAIHADWLNNTGADTISSSITDVMNSALAYSPWTGLTAYDPDAQITAYEGVMAAFKALLAGISDTGDWNSLYTQAETSIDNPVVIANDVAAFAAILDDQITTTILPRFRRGMQDINAVVSSAFPIGEAVIEAFRDRDVAKYTTGLMMGKDDKKLTATSQMLQLMIQRLSWEESYVRVYTEGQRIKIVAKKEETDQNAKLDEEDALWDLEVFQYGGNIMAAIQGGTVGSKPKAASPFQSALGGAMSGAAAGAMVGASMGSSAGPYGAVIGGILGAGAGLLSIN